jgi:hypothetical protein
MEPYVKTRQILSHVAIVTGGGRGLGRAMVLGLAQAGMHVIATVARECTEVEAVAEEVRQICGESRVLPLVADVTQENDCTEVVDAAAERFGRLDILVNNASGGMKYVSAARSFDHRPGSFRRKPMGSRAVVWWRSNGGLIAMGNRPQKRRRNKQAGRGRETEMSSQLFGRNEISRLAPIEAFVPYVITTLKSLRLLRN